MKNIQQIITFLLLAEAKNFTKVAKQLGITTSAVSRQIKSLEDSLSQELFIRSPRRVVLTDFGEQFYRECHKLSDSVKEVNDFINSQNKEPKARITVKCTIGSGRKFLKFLPQFKQKHPNIAITFDFSDTTPSVLDSPADIIFPAPQLEGITDDYRYRSLGRVKGGLFAAPSYLATQPQIQSQADLAEHEFVGMITIWELNELPLANNETLKINDPTYIFSDFDTAVQATIKGLGLCMAPEAMCKAALQDGSLVRVLPDLDYVELELFIFYKYSKYEQTNIRAFVDFYYEHCSFK